MGSILESAVAGAIGYGVAKLTQKDKPEVGPQAIEHAIAANPGIPISCIVEDYARIHGIYGRSNDFARELMRIAENYRDPYNL